MSEIKDFFGTEAYTSAPFTPGSVLIIPWQPSNINVEMPGFLFCDGTSISKTTFANLYAAIGNKYGSGSTWFRVPDYRGLFLRGRGGVNDPNVSLRTLNSNAIGNVTGSIQDQEIDRHTHYGSIDQNATGGYGWYDLNPCPDVNICGNSTTYQSDAAGGSETRPKNFATIFMIKY